jgi:hypothetical protein
MHVRTHMQEEKHETHAEVHSRGKGTLDPRDAVRAAAADDFAEDDTAPSSAHLSFHARASLPVLLLAARVVTTSPDGSLYCLLKTVVG